MSRYGHLSRPPGYSPCSCGEYGWLTDVELLGYVPVDAVEYDQKCGRMLVPINILKEAQHRLDELIDGEEEYEYV